mgnify:CR=1 FL=1
MDFETIHALLGSYTGTRLVDANGGVFAMHDPEGNLPPQRQIPWAILIDSNAYDTASDLDRPGVFRLDLALTRARFRDLIDPAAQYDLTELDVVMPHPGYAGRNWVCVLNPKRTWPVVRGLIAEANEFAVRKYENAARRRSGR